MISSEGRAKIEFNRWMQGYPQKSVYKISRMQADVEAENYLELLKEEPLQIELEIKRCRRLELFNAIESF